MDRFVCVRLVQGFGLDLSVFQFDWRTPWQVFLMNADRAVYGRVAPHYGDDLEALRKSLEGALALHAAWPSNREALAGKSGLPLPWKSPEEMPGLQERGKPRRAVGTEGCIHCHNILEGAQRSYKAAGEAVPERFAAPWPSTSRAGFRLDPKERATVSEVTAGTPAAEAGLQAGDRILRFGGQPPVSSDDVRWVLWRSEDPPTIAIEVERGGERRELRLSLPAGWRTR